MDDANLTRHLFTIKDHLSKISSELASKKVDDVNRSLIRSNDLLNTISYNSTLSFEANKKLLNLIDLKFNKLYEYIIYLIVVIILVSGIPWYIKLGFVVCVTLKYILMSLVKKILMYVRQAEINKVEFEKITKNLRVIDLS